MPYCARCGHQIAHEMKFCPACGQEQGVDFISPNTPPSTKAQPFANPSVPSTPSNLSTPPPMYGNKLKRLEEVDDGESYQTQAVFMNGKRARIANEGGRFFAFGIDFFIIGTIYLLLTIDLNPLFALGISVVMGLYYVIIEILTKGRSIAKFLFGYHTVDLTTFEPASASQLILHSLGKIFLPIDILLGLMVFKRKEKRLGLVRFMQKLSNTTVIRWVR